MRTRCRCWCLKIGLSAVGIREKEQKFTGEDGVNPHTNTTRMQMLRMANPEVFLNVLIMTAAVVKSKYPTHTDNNRLIQKGRPSSRLSRVVHESSFLNSMSDDCVLINTLTRTSSSISSEWVPAQEHRHKQHLSYPDQWTSCGNTVLLVCWQSGRDPIFPVINNSCAWSNQIAKKERKETGCWSKQSESISIIYFNSLFTPKHNNPHRFVPVGVGKATICISRGIFSL